jgi:regulator of replication initiation timing
MRKMGTRFQNVDLTLKELENRVTVTEEDIEEIKQKILSMGSGNNSSDPSADKEKLRLEKELKKLEESNKKDSNRNDEWRRRMD